MGWSTRLVSYEHARLRRKNTAVWDFRSVLMCKWLKGFPKRPKWTYAGVSFRPVWK